METQGITAGDRKTRQATLRTCFFLAKKNVEDFSLFCYISLK